ncbi:UbiH/UbiF/VisC/COQ6 family ubiquinone biosynthesis hydroxylase [Rhodobacteraceae bacterium]|nr:UbiH/UbiF/VisC/COQ6 family ubiquinone biosynthesis hydroxylase [Paracoccaceae bacterium]
MNYDTDIAIVGAGLNGAMMSLALAEAGFTVTLIDPQTLKSKQNSHFDGRSYSLAIASVRLMQALGLWEELAPNAQPILEIKVADGRAYSNPSPYFLHFDHHEIEEGPMGHMVEDRHLRPLLQKRLQSVSQINYRADLSVSEMTITDTHAELRLNTEETITTRLVIGADGRQSQTAERAGIKRTGWRYGQTALVCALSHNIPHQGVACQYFMPPGPLAILPLTGNRSSIVWTESDANAAAIMAMDNNDYMAVLQPRIGDYLGKVELAGMRYSYPLDLTIAQNYVMPRLALVGDAAHGVHPIAGQGLNLGLRDIAALSEVLSDARLRGEDFSSLAVLLRYQEWRRFDTTALAVATDAVNKLFSNDNSFLRTLRDLGMGAINSLPALRRSFIREAAGLTGDLPRLMQ